MIYNSLLKNRINKGTGKGRENVSTGFSLSFLYDLKHCHAKEMALRFNHFIF